MYNECIILAAGIGSRLALLTKETPKCCLEFINSETLIQRLVRQIFNFTNVDRVTVCVGFHSEKVINNLSSFNENVSFIYNPIYDKTNNMYSSLLGIESFINPKSLIIMNADCVYSDNILKIISNSSGSVIPYDEFFWSDESMKVSLDSQESITDISKKLLRESSNYVSIDLYKLQGNDFSTYKNACLTYINKGEINLWNEVALQQCIKSNTIKFKGLEIKNNHWYEIDTLQDYEQAKLIFDK